MGHKVNPIGLRLGIIKDWQSHWYADRKFHELLAEDLTVRSFIKQKYAEAGVSKVEIERTAKEITLTIHAARPGVVIGRGGQKVDEMRDALDKLTNKRVRVNVQEVKEPALDAYLVARSVAEQIERRVSYRRAMKQAITRAIQSGAKGVKVSAAGRLMGAEIARRETLHQGRVPLHTLRADIDYGFTEAATMLGRIGIKVWIYKGEILPVRAEEESEEFEMVSTPEGQTTGTTKTDDKSGTIANIIGEASENVATKES